MLKNKKLNIDSFKFKVYFLFSNFLIKQGHKENSFYILKTILYYLNLNLKKRSDSLSNIKIDPLEHLAFIIRKLYTSFHLKSCIVGGKKKRLKKINIPVLFLKEEQSIFYAIKLIYNCALKRKNKKKGFSLNLSNILFSELLLVEQNKSLANSLFSKFKKEILENQVKIKNHVSTLSRLEDSIYKFNLFKKRACAILQRNKEFRLKNRQNYDNITNLINKLNQNKKLKNINLKKKNRVKKNINYKIQLNQNQNQKNINYNMKQVKNKKNINYNMKQVMNKKNINLNMKQVMNKKNINPNMKQVMNKKNINPNMKQVMNKKNINYNMKQVMNKKNINYNIQQDRNKKNINPNRIIKI